MERVLPEVGGFSIIEVPFQPLEYQVPPLLRCMVMASVVGLVLPVML